MDQVVTLTGTLTDTGEHRHTTVVLRNTLDHLLDEDGLADARTTEQTDLSTLHVGGQQVDDLDAGLEHRRLGLELVEGRRLAVDAPPLGDLDLLARLGVEDLAGHVEHVALGHVADRHRDRAARVTDFLTTDDTVGGLERDGADEVVAKVLCDLEGQLAGLALDRDRGGQRVVDVGDRVMRELDVDDGAGDARDAADDRGLLGGCGGSHGHSLSCQVYLPDARASAPPTISAICCVISACRALLRRRV